MVTLQIVTRGVTDPETLRAMTAVPREQFVPHNLWHRAYEDRALVIGYGQTISQPYIVALCTAALGLDRWRAANPGTRPCVLDIGTGSGYQAAVLAEMGADVTSIELDPHLAEAARERLAHLGYAVQVIQGDGADGFAANAPYAGIVVAAAAPEIPPRLLEQLGEGATLVIPVGDRERQTLTSMRRSLGQFHATALDSVVFVPLLGSHGFR